MADEYPVAAQRTADPRFSPPRTADRRLLAEQTTDPRFSSEQTANPRFFAKRTVAHLRGASAERQVASWLERRGGLILARNYRVPGIGELDLVCRFNREILIIEVKARHPGAVGSEARYGGAGAAIRPAKRRRLFAATRQFLCAQQLNEAPVRLLAAIVEIDSEGFIRRINWQPLDWN